jgi:hypothetical protein
MSRRTRILESIDERLRELEHKADVMEKVLLVKEPGTPIAAEAYEGLRKQVVAAATARRTHLVQLATMAVAVRRATSVDDLEPLLREWMRQADVQEVFDLPPGIRVQDLFEDANGGHLAEHDVIECVEPAYVDAKTRSVLRLGRARPAGAEPSAPETLEAAETLEAPRSEAGDEPASDAEQLDEEQRA